MPPPRVRLATRIHSRAHGDITAVLLPVIGVARLLWTAGAGGPPNEEPGASVRATTSEHPLRRVNRSFLDRDDSASSDSPFRGHRVHRAAVTRRAIDRALLRLRLEILHPPELLVD